MCFTRKFSNQWISALARMTCGAKKRLFFLLKVWLFSVPLCLCGEIASAQETITIAVASSLYAKMQTQTQAYEKDHDVKIRLISGSTGRLYHQIIQGAPFDVFISADDIHAKALEKKHQAIAVSSAGNGFLGLKVGGKFTRDLTQLSKAKIQRIAIANPTVAPFGMAAKKILEQQGIWEILQEKLVYSQNALQAKMLVEKGLVDAAFVPVTSHQTSLAIITYHSVLLKENASARAWLKSLETKNRDLALQTF